MVQTLRDLELLVESRYPIIAIESVEEERVEDMLRRAALELQMPLYTWSAAEGLHRLGSEGPLPDGKTPARALAAAGALTGDGLFYFKDLHRFLTDPEVVRRLHDAAQRFVRRRGAIVLSSAHIELPDELRELAAPLTLDLLDGEELRALARRVLADLKREHPIAVRLSEDEIDGLADLLKGLTLFEAEHVLARVVLADLALDRAAPAGLHC